MKTPYSTEINSWGQFSDTNNIKRGELSNSARRFIKEKEKYLEKTCRKIWLFKNRFDEVFIFGRFTKGKDKTIVTISSYVPYIGFVTTH